MSKSYKLEVSIPLHQTILIEGTQKPKLTKATKPDPKKGPTKNQKPTP